MKLYIKEFFGELVGSILLILSGFIYKNGFVSGIVLAFLLVVGESFYSVSLNPMIATAHYLGGLINTDQFKLHLSAEVLAAVIAYLIYLNYIKK
jgi:hypothetical protein